MHRFAIALALFAACHKKPTTPTAGSGSGSGSNAGSADTAPFAKSVTFSWGVSPSGATSDVYLAGTDERGQTVSHSIGNFPGTCTPATAAPEMTALIALDCKDGATGVELQLIDQTDHVLVMKLRVDSGVKPDRMGREQIAEFEVPLGAKIKGI